MPDDCEAEFELASPQQHSLLRVLRNKWKGAFAVPKQNTEYSCGLCGLGTSGPPHLITYCPAANKASVQLTGHRLDSPLAYGHSSEPSTPALLVAAYHLACEDNACTREGNTYPESVKITQGVQRLVTRWWHLLSEEKKNDACWEAAKKAQVQMGRAQAMG